MDFVDVRKLHPYLSLPVIFAESHGLVTFSHDMIKCTYVKFVTPLFVTHDPLVFLWVVQTLHSSVTLIAFDALWTGVPTNSINQSLTVFRGIFEQIWRSSEVSCMVSVDTTL